VGKKRKPAAKVKTGKRTTPAYKADKTVNRGRHEAHCKICAHPQREEIERELLYADVPQARAELAQHVDSITLRPTEVNGKRYYVATATGA